MMYYKLNSSFTSDACQSLVGEEDGAIRPIQFLGRESKSGLSMEVTHASDLTPTLMIRVSNLIYKVKSEKEIPYRQNGKVVIVPEGTHCHTAPLESLEYQFVTVEEVQKGLLEWEEIRQSGNVPALEERIERWGPILGEGLRRATRPWVGERRTGGISHGEFQGKLERADTIEVFDDSQSFTDYHCEMYSWETYILREYNDGRYQYIPQYQEVTSSEDEVIEIDID